MNIVSNRSQQNMRILTITGSAGGTRTPLLPGSPIVWSTGVTRGEWGMPTSDLQSADGGGRGSRHLCVLRIGLEDGSKRTGAV